MRRYVPLLALLIAGLLWPLHADAQSNGWSQPVALSDKARTKSQVSWYPDLVIGPDGSVHVVWCSFPQLTRATGETVYTDALMYRVYREGAWSDINDIFSQSRQLEQGSEYTVRSSIVMGVDGKLHVLLRDKVAIRQFSAPWERAWSANSWSELSNLGEGYYNALAMDSRGTLHALRTQGGPDDPLHPRPQCPACAHLYYARSTDGGGLWSSRVNLSEGLQGANRPEVAVDRRDRIHVVWDDGFDWYVGKGSPRAGVYRRSDDGGATWSAPIFFSLPNDAVQQTTLALTDDGNPVVVYRSVAGGALYFQQSRDGGASWSSPAVIPGVLALDTVGRGLDRYDLAADSLGRLHLVMVGYRGGEVREQSVPALLHLSWDGTAWSAPEEIMRRADYLPEWPQIEVANGNLLHVVWFTRHDLPRQTADEDTRDYQVWYSSKAVVAPMITALPLLTPTPASSPIVTPQAPTATVSPTPLPAAVLQAPPIAERAAWEARGIRVVGIALAPIGGLIAFLWLSVRRARRPAVDPRHDKG